VRQPYATTSDGVINSYSSFRDEFNQRKILSNPFDFDESFDQEELNERYLDENDDTKVIILSGSR
jgi:hypothetical protein